ncbi:hypothetical protein L6164_012727 [Bauhinia variegata]|uniref:Uncharacterized protein n=1 Tax=Bauhinia variegata TaxID=167791 RepID=A0ACB9PA60_BAUVA|nr:hypothetical protein L6164_012727 [Bauhinia variegata]
MFIISQCSVASSIGSVSSRHFGRAIVMPNLKPPITTTKAAVAYRESILKALSLGSNFTPLKWETFSISYQLYPAGATTNSQDGVTDLFG